jgi:hypothetical protein
LAGLFFGGCSKNQNKNNLPKYVEKFRSQIENFEEEKQEADEKAKEGLTVLTTLEEAVAAKRGISKKLDEAYKAWGKVEGEVKDVNKAFKKMGKRATALLNAAAAKIKSIGNEKIKKQLIAKHKETSASYLAVLDKTEKAIDKMNTLHKEAMDIIKALDAAVTLGVVDNEIKEGMASIRAQIQVVMKDLNTSITESTKLYKQYMGDEEKS